MDFISGDNTTFVFYFSNDLILHRTKIENKEKLISTQIGELLTPPSKEDYERLTYYTTELNFTDEKKYDIVISGLGFICLKGNVKVKIATIKGVTVYKREAIIW